MFTKPTTWHCIYTSSNPLPNADPIRNIRFIMPGFEDSHRQSLFHPDYVASLKPYSHLRFMPMQHINYDQYKASLLGFLKVFWTQIRKAATLTLHFTLPLFIVPSPPQMTWHRGLNGQIVASLPSTRMLKKPPWKSCCNSLMRYCMELTMLHCLSKRKEESKLKNLFFLLNCFVYTPLLQVGSHPWFNIPHRADTQYITNFANMIKVWRRRGLTG